MTPGGLGAVRRKIDAEDKRGKISYGRD